MNFSNRVINMQASPIRKLVPFAEEAKKSGKKVYHLNIGQPDIETPPEFFTAVKEADIKVLAYSLSQGMPELIDSFSKYYARYGLSFDQNEILITNGGSEAILFALIATCDVGDEVLVPEPFYTNYNGFGSSAQVNIVPITTKAENGFALPSASTIEALVTNKTKAILLSNPGNPTGAVYSSEEMDAIALVAKKHNLFIISDEVYREFIYDGMKFKSFAEYTEIANQVILTDSISKRYSACGARIGCIASKNKELITQMLKLCQSRLCVPTLEQIGAAALINVSSDYMDAAILEYKKRRDIVYNALNKMDGVLCKEPKGAFYVIAKLPVKNAEDFVIWLLKEFNLNGETVMLAPAEGFYATPGLGIDEVRISYVLKETDLLAAMAVLDAGLKAYHLKNQ